MIRYSFLNTRQPHNYADSFLSSLLTTQASQLIFQVSLHQHQQRTYYTNVPMYVPGNVILSFCEETVKNEVCSICCRVTAEAFYCFRFYFLFISCTSQVYVHCYACSSIIHRFAHFSLNNKNTERKR